MRDLTRSQVDIILATLPAAAIILFDRLSKSFFSGLLSLHESLPVIPDVLHMTLVHNTGIAFGLFQNQIIVLFVIPLVLLFFLGFNIYYYRNNNHGLSPFYIIGFSLILGGAIGNLYDRIVYGYVIDFIDFQIWPVFNIADSAITIGGVIIAIKCIQLSSKS